VCGQRPQIQQASESVCIRRRPRPVGAMGAGAGTVQPQMLSSHAKMEPGLGSSSSAAMPDGTNAQAMHGVPPPSAVEGGIAWLLAAIDREKSEKEWLANKYEWLVKKFDDQCEETKRLNEELASTRNELQLAKASLDQNQGAAGKSGQSVSFTADALQPAGFCVPAPQAPALLLGPARAASPSSASGDLPKLAQQDAGDSPQPTSIGGRLKERRKLTLGALVVEHENKPAAVVVTARRLDEIGEDTSEKAPVKLEAAAGPVADKPLENAVGSSTVHAEVAVPAENKASLSPPATSMRGFVSTSVKATPVKVEIRSPARSPKRVLSPGMFATLPSLPTYSDGRPGSKEVIEEPMSALLRRRAEDWSIKPASPSFPGGQGMGSRSPILKKGMTTPAFVIPSDGIAEDEEEDAVTPLPAITQTKSECVDAVTPLPAITQTKSECVGMGRIVNHKVSTLEDCPCSPKRPPRKGKQFD